MGSLFVHKYQLLPLMIAALMHIKESRFFEILNPQIEFWIIFVCSSIFFVFSSFRAHVFQTLIQSLAFLIVVALFLNRSLESPSFGVLLATIYLTFASSFWRDSKSPIYNVTLRDLIICLGLSWITFLFYLLVSHGHEMLLAFGLATISFSLLQLALQWLRVRSDWVAVMWAAMFLGVFFTFQFVVLDAAILVALYLIVTGFVLTLIFKNPRQELDAFLRSLFVRPEIVVLSYFLGLILLGSLFLQAPLSSAKDVAHPWIDALFTAASAASLTGLAVLNTGLDFSFTGQLIILALIQAGALGIVSLSSWAILLFQSKRLGVQYEELVQGANVLKAQVSPAQALKRILMYFFAFEFCGIFLLFLSFLGTESHVLGALWKAVFTGISAFCNAGFALNSTSLVDYNQNGMILMTVSILMIAGGFAPMMALELPRKFWKAQLNLQDRLVVNSTIILILLSFAFYLALEWGYSLSGMSLSDKLINSFFQGSTVRSGGFNSVDMSQLRDTTVILFFILMLIGGNPGGAAGGVKTVPFAIFILATVCALNGSRGVKVYNRYIPNEIVIKSITIITLWLSSALVLFLMLSITQNIETIPLLFETFSALGTCGLSLGATAELDEVGKFILSVGMLIGRVGPIGILILVVSRRKEAAHKVPKEEVYVS